MLRCVPEMDESASASVLSYFVLILVTLRNLHKSYSYLINGQYSVRASYPPVNNGSTVVLGGLNSDCHRESDVVC